MISIATTDPLGQGSDLLKTIPMPGTMHCDHVFATLSSGRFGHW